MTHADKIKDMSRRLAQVKRWSKRLERLYKVRGIREAEFCRQNGFTKGWFNRSKNLCALPTQKSLDKVDQAFSKYGV